MFQCVLWVLGGSFLGIKLSANDAHHSPPFSAKLKNPWSYTSIPPCLHGVTLNLAKHNYDFLPYKARTVVEVCAYVLLSLTFFIVWFLLGRFLSSSQSTICSWEYDETWGGDTH
jgi:hypothetical protein